jgi:hypothetical protein
MTMNDVVPSFCGPSRRGSRHIPFQRNPCHSFFLRRRCLASVSWFWPSLWLLAIDNSSDQRPTTQLTCLLLLLRLLYGLVWVPHKPGFRWEPFTEVAGNPPKTTYMMVMVIVTVDGPLCL